ncbi:MAG TPA: aminotransferase class I/II-fold pyridoxal phosphate-dependent enzyme [Polyangia bacterium]|jgi:aspartate aminotransferase
MSELSPVLTRLLAAQERVDELRAAALRHGGRHFADLAYANSYDGPAPETLAALRRAVDAVEGLALQYTPYGGTTVARRLAAEGLRESHGAPFDLKDVILTPGAMAALNVVFRSVRRDDEASEVVVITPCWLDYPLYLENLGLRPRLVPLDWRTLRLDLAAIEAALSPRTRALVLSQPANPTGLIYGEDELRQLGELLARSPSRPLLVSDECHRDLVFAPHVFASPGAHYDATCVVYSFGKRLFLQGQRLGYAAVSPRHPARRAYARTLEQLTRVMGFCTPTALMQLAVGELLRVPTELAGIERRRARTLAGLVDAGYDVVPTQATFFVYPRAPGGDGFAFAARLAEEGVFVLPSTVFHGDGHFRLSLTASDEMLDRGLDVLRVAKAAS